MGKNKKNKKQQSEPEPESDNGDVEDMGIGSLLGDPASNWAANKPAEPDPWDPLPSEQKPQKKTGKGKGAQPQGTTWGADTSTWGRGVPSSATTAWGSKSASDPPWGTRQDDDAEEEEEEEEEENLWGVAGERSWGVAGEQSWGGAGEQSWGIPAKQTGWKGWTDEAKRNSKTFSTGKQKQTPSHHQQQAQLNALLSANQNFFPQHSQRQQPEQGKKSKKQQKKESAAAHRQNQSEATNWWGGAAAAATDYGWGPIPEVDEEEEEDRHVHFTPSKNATNLWADAAQSTSYTMPSKTFAHATKGTTAPLEAGPPYNMLTDVQFEESHGEALKPAHQALFGKSRFAKDRIYWMFRPDHDPRVVAVLNWIQAVSYSLGAFGLHRFLQSRERGALFTNVDYRSPNNPTQPCFDWLTFDELQPSMDKILQESIALYDPAVQVIVFVLLPSKSGKSVAMWRRRITVPNNVRLMMQGEIMLCLNGLRREKDYLVHVDELPDTQKRPDHPMAATTSPRRLRRSSLPPPSTTPVIDLWEKPKKRKWWQNLFRVEW